MRNESCLGEKYFHPRVVFMNSNVHLSDKLLSTKEVIGPDHLLKFLESFEKGLAWSVANSMIPSFITGKIKNKHAPYAKITSSLIQVLYTFSPL